MRELKKSLEIIVFFAMVSAAIIAGILLTSLFSSCNREKEVHLEYIEDMLYDPVTDKYVVEYKNVFYGVKSDYVILDVNKEDFYEIVPIFINWDTVEIKQYSIEKYHGNDLIYGKIKKNNKKQ